MPRYRYTDVWPRIFTGLQHGVNITVTRHDPDAAADAAGSTVVLLPGDEIDTSEPVDSALLTEIPGPAPVPAPASPPAAPTSADVAAPATS